MGVAFNVFRAKIYNLAGEGKYLVSVNLSVCMESTSSCQIDVPVLTNALIPRVSCDWNFAFADPGKKIFNLSYVFLNTI